MSLCSMGCDGLAMHKPVTDKWLNAGMLPVTFDLVAFTCAARLGFKATITIEQC